MKRQPLKVGFDLDGVLLYNPARIVRPIIVFLKKYLLKRDLNKFYYPKNSFEKMFWRFLHQSSLKPAFGFEEIRKLIIQKKIQAYIISARYELLENDFNHWVKIIDPNKQFKKCYFNDKNEQPQLFKERVINNLKLDIYVEDNWDIVRKLKSQNSKVKIYWIYNILDRHIKYKYKFANLKQVMLYVTRYTLHE